jgi:dihydroorotate dehydrogenase
MIDLFALARPVLMRLPAETAHLLTLSAARAGLAPKQRSQPDPSLGVDFLGHHLSTPLGLAAGFDKNALVFDRLYDAGFSFVEVGGVTPRGQVGNPRPRLFRLPEDRAIINRMGFNNDGAEVIAERVRCGRKAGRLLGINLASNSDSADPANDFVQLVARFAALADYLTIDISCPNTTNGQLFLRSEPLQDLLGRINAWFAEHDQPRPALFAKTGPDVSEEQTSDIVDCITAAGIDGMIVSNTTIARPSSLRGEAAAERGGLSGPPLFDSSTRMLAQIYRQAGDRLTLIGVGGISSGADAYAKLRAGATVLQLYTALVYQGPRLIGRINDELAALLRRDGFASLADARPSP